MSCLDVKKTMKLKELKELTQVKLLKIYGIEESRSIFHLLLNEFLIGPITLSSMLIPTMLNISLVASCSTK